MNILKAGGLLALLLGAGAAAASAPRHDGAHGVDAQLRRALNNVRAERLESALVEVDELIARYPNFRLAHLVRGDLLLARTRPITTFGNTGHAARERMDELRAAGRITISHGPLYHLGMPPMSMPFRVEDHSLLDRVKEGDKVKFHADVAGGELTVTRIERVP